MKFIKIEHALFDSGLLILEAKDPLFKLNKREKEKAGQDMLLKKMYPEENTERSYLESGKPYFLNKSSELSLSHCENAIACQVSENIPCGVDVQHYKPKITRLADKYLNTEELNWVKQIQDEQEKIKTLTAMWSCKEALYKMYGKGFIDYINLFTLHPFTAENGTISADADLGDGIKRYHFQAEFTETFVWVFHTLSPTLLPDEYATRKSI
ncbi:MAG: 4'-phosphopantetheinyl transferase superfamily protein [Flavobacteriales bacterium]|nr:4'-phosphopantetheinyl transferase superfamily protein [Flavobacteriales bacterium]